jgi:pimeloyl-ACP methyl ester carboxylesterase
MFADAGYAPVSPGWPDDPDTVAEANADPDVFANKTIGMVADHCSGVIGTLSRKPVVIGHSFGGLLAQIIAGRGQSAATVAIDAAPFRGVLPLPLSSLKAAFPVLETRPTGTVPFRSPTTSSATASPTPSPRRKRGGSTTPSRCRPRELRCFRPPMQTSTR